jgi:hypothetical protein
MATRDDSPMLLCYDGSEDAKHAIERAARLLSGRPAMVMTVWQSTGTLDSFAWSGAMAGMVDFVELDRAAAEDSTAASREAAVIVVGSRGLTGVRSMLLGSVSGAVAHHADRPTLVIHRPTTTDEPRGAGAQCRRSALS